MKKSNHPIESINIIDGQKVKIFKKYIIVVNYYKTVIAYKKIGKDKVQKIAYTNIKNVTTFNGFDFLFAYEYLTGESL